MARLRSQMDMEYVPTHLPSVAEIAGLIDTGSLPGRLLMLDPCAGEGDALRALEAALLSRRETEGARGYEVHSETYGVELDRKRARAARKKLDKVVQADFFNMVISDGFNILFLNPPYDYDPEYRRLEHRFLLKAAPLLNRGGLLIFVAPRHELRVSADFLARNFSEFRVWQPRNNPDAERFDQIFLTARRYAGGHPGGPAEAKRQLHDFVEGKVDFIGEERPSYRIGQPGDGIERFVPLAIDYAGALEEVAASGLETRQEWRDWSEPPENEIVLPRMPPRMGHMGLIMAGGGVGGLGIPVTDGVEAKIFRATSRKIKVAEPQNESGTVEVISERMSNSAVLLDPVRWEFQDEVDLAEFVVKWRAPLAKHLAGVMPPKYSPAGLRELLGGAPDYGKLLRRPMPGNGQRLAIEGAMHGMLAGERGTTIVGEMGTGKTYISMAAAHLAGKRRVMVLCPPTLVWKWEDEILKTVPGARVYVIGKRPVGAKAKSEFYKLASSPLKQLDRLHRHYGENDLDVPVYFVLAHSAAKLSYGRIPAVIWRWGCRPQPRYSETTGELIHSVWQPFREQVAEEDENGEPVAADERIAQRMCCPECGQPVIDRRGEYAGWDWLAKGRRRCLNEVTVGRQEFEDKQGGEAYGTETRECGAVLWQALARNYAAPAGVDTGFRQHEEQLKDRMRRRYIYAAGVDAERALALGGRGSLSALYAPDEDAVYETAGREAFRVKTYPPRRYDLAEYIKKYLPGFIDLLIADECHQFKAGDSAQGLMARMLAEVAPHRVALTGTLMAGKASDLFHLLYGFGGPEVRRDFRHNDATRWRNIHGFVEKTVYLDDENSKRSRARRNSRTKDLPGAMPSALRYILGQSAFIRLKDVAAGLPPFSEHVITAPLDEELDPETDSSQRLNYKALEESILSEIKSLTFSNPRAAQHLVSVFAQAALTYPDACTQRNACTVYSPADGALIIDRAPLSESKIYPKEEKLIEICRAEKEAGRKTLVFATHTNKRDLLPRLQDILERNGLKVAALRADTVDADKRMPWLEKRLKEGLDVLICHPQLVETGVDMLDFPGIVWFEADYNTARVRQASRRSWRIGQKMPVRIYYLTYEDTKQTQAIYLVAQKVATSLAIEGDLSGEGLTALAGGSDNMGRSIAQMLVDGDADFEGSFEAGINIAGFQNDDDDRLLADGADDWELESDIEREAEESDGLTDDVAWSLVGETLTAVERRDEPAPMPAIGSPEACGGSDAPEPAAYGAVSLDAWMSAFELTPDDMERGKVKRGRKRKDERGAIHDRR